MEFTKAITSKQAHQTFTAKDGDLLRKKYPKMFEYGWGINIS